MKMVSPVYDPDINWVTYIKERSNYIIFLDEDFNNNLDFNLVNAINKSNNIYVIITRKIPKELTLSVYSIYRLKKDNNLIYLDNMFKYSKREYDIQNIITEDSGLGYKFINNIYNNKSVISASGKSNILNILNNTKGHKVVFLFVDLEAFGSLILQSRKVNKRIKNLIIFNVASFEKIILEIYFNNKYYMEISNPEYFCNYSEYITMERFYTNLLKIAFNEVGIIYNKNSINVLNYINNNNLNKAYIDNLYCLVLNNRL